ncbi:MAG: hypothetical protein NTY99_03215 [DPANN group archaeon]|nr:hypothetical protein [DPANN group archaeon]
MKRGQFYIITLVFVAASLIILLMFTQFAEFGPLSVKNPKLGFENVQNSISQRNAWLATYWLDLRWQTKTVVTITGTPTNPVQINANIIGDCINTVRVGSKSGSQLNEIPSQVTAAVAPCDVVFSTIPGINTYEIYWNSTATVPTKTIGIGTPPSYTKTLAQVPQEGICSYYSSTLPKKDVLFQCSATPGTNTYNYSINYRSTDFTFSGNLS